MCMSVLASARVVWKNKQCSGGRHSLTRLCTSRDRTRLSPGESLATLSSLEATDPRQPMISFLAS